MAVPGNPWGNELVKPIYLDNQATTPVDPRVTEAMLPYLTEEYGNAASVHHGYGRRAKEAVEYARKNLADGINARAKDIIFTSGATEAINLGIRGICEKYPGKGHIITQATEHKAVLDTCEAMAKKGWAVTILPVDSDGRVDPGKVQDTIQDNTALISIMHANNEIGTFQPIGEIGAICKNAGIPFLVDASQSFGKFSIDVDAMNIDLLSATAHKIYGPKGIGMLYASSKDPKVQLMEQITGGGHEHGRRSGTLPVHQIVGFGKAIEICDSIENEKIAHLQKLLIEGILHAHPEVKLNGSIENRLPHNINLCFPGIDAETLISKLKGVACSTGSACSTADLEPSHVLKAIGLSNEMAHSSIRFSLGRFNSTVEIEKAIQEIKNAVELLKQKSSHYKLNIA